MKHSYAAPSALLAITCLPLALGAVDLSYAPEQGSRWLRVFECSTTAEFDELSVVMGGQPIDSQFLPQIEVEFRDTLHLEVTDELRGVELARPTLVHRTYGDVWREVEESMEVVGMGGADGPSVSQGEGRSPLEGRTVAFEWSEDGEDVAASWVERESDDDLLEGLVGDLDLLAWLPEGAVKVGDSWTVPASMMDGLLVPGGELSIELEGQNLETFEPKGDDDAELDGDLVLRLEEIQDADGRRFAVVSIEGDFTSELTYAGDLEDVPVADGTTSVTDKIEYELEGELIWDLNFAIMSALEVTAETLTTSHAIKDDGQEGPAFESIATLLGETRVSITVEPAD
ncbi:MAG: hypothetical protein ACI8QZ_003698 [Chlamydiales bacterium]|jgi:hypothetical protein